MRLDQAGFALSLALGALLAPAFAYAQWQPDGIPVAALNGNQHRPVSAPDGAGGVYLAWFDDRGPYGRQIYAQRLSASRRSRVETHGIKVRNLPGTNWELAIAADGQGGAILAWYTSPDSTQDNILAQRLDGAGNCLWDTNGVAVCSEPRRQIDPAIVSDGAGGAIIAWRDERSSFDGDVYAQRMGAAGARMWNRLALPSAWRRTSARTGDRRVRRRGCDRRMEDYRGIDTDIYAQRVDASGAVEWMPDGVPVPGRRPPIRSGGHGGRGERHGARVVGFTFESRLRHLRPASLQRGCCTLGYERGRDGRSSD